ncbi:hypothetical protein [Rhizorhabdus dicambivorans]|uniref:hypothetical protein n=1 Tax=Rhizorhabdus dicambivorans TaxID=1850238 RepID=UPI00111271E7|nr:hypothetical protein [Rhizorhabdus dicambivorans]
MRKAVFLSAWLALASGVAAAVPTTDLSGVDLSGEEQADGASEKGGERMEQPLISAGPGLMFMNELGLFRRAGARRYGDQGQNLAVAYELMTPSRVAVSLFVSEAAPAIGATPEAVSAARETNCYRDFERRELQLKKIHPSAKLIERTKAPPPAGSDAATGLRAVYEMKAKFRGRRMALRSELALFCYVAGDWQIAYRATSPADYDYQPELAELISNIGWPQREAAAPEPGDIAIHVRGYDTAFLMAGFIVAGSATDLAALEERARQRGLWLRRMKEKDGEKLVAMFIGQSGRSVAAREIYQEAISGDLGQLRLEVMIIAADDLAAGADPSQALRTVSSSYVELR